MTRERFKNNEYSLTRSVSLSDSDLDIAKALGGGNASHGIKMALRLSIKLKQVAFDELL
jgi:hypothetical protein